MSKKSVVQNYPRVADDSNLLNGCLDDTHLVAHSRQITLDELKHLIRNAIDAAERKARREILSIPGEATIEEQQEMFSREGHELFKYFRKYVGDPAASAFQILRKTLSHRSH
jgi:hypothetical protein